MFCYNAGDEVAKLQSFQLIMSPTDSSELSLVDSTE